jgi:uncharacterized membrane protein HdeD (DUF308 family)
MDRVILAKNWWAVLIRGIVAILLGIFTLVMPGITLVALVFLFGGYALVDGVASIAGAVRAAEAHERWGALLFAGLTGIAAALVTVMWPAITALALVYIIAAWALLTGIFQIAAAMRLRQYVSGEWLLVLTGIVSILFGVLIIMAPLAGALVIAFWLGAYAMIAGVLLVGLAFRLRSWGRLSTAGPQVIAPAH